MASSPPHKKFSLRGLRRRFKSTSSVDAPSLPGTTTAADRPLTKRSTTEPQAGATSSRSGSFDKNLPPLPPLPLLRDSPSPGMPTPQLRDSPSPDMPTPETNGVHPENEDELQMPTPRLPETNWRLRMPIPESLMEQDAPVEMPVPATNGPPTPLQTQQLSVPPELPAADHNLATVQENGPNSDEDPIQGLAEVADKVHDGKPQSSNNTRDMIADKGLGVIEGKISVISSTVTTVQQVVQPVATALEASSAVQALKSGLNSFMEEIPTLMKCLDEVSKIHPFISVAVLAFKAAYTMEMTRRTNDKRITSLYVAMKDMISVLVQLRTVKDKNDVGPDGRTIEARMQSLSNQTATDIKDCANICDTYTKKRLLVKVLKGQVWEVKLVEWVTTFGKRKEEFMMALAMHTATAVESVKDTVEAMDAKLSALTEKLMEMFKELTPKDELDLARKVKDRGGIEAARENDSILRELYDLEAGTVDGKKRKGATSGPAVHQNESAMKYSTTKSQSNSRTTSDNWSLQDLKNDLREDWETMISNNMQTFEGKFMLHQRQLQEELSRVIHEENNRLLDEVNKGPHDLIKHEELKSIWKEMGWRRNVKARLFVMTLRDNYGDIPTRHSAGVTAITLGKDATDAQSTDEWAFQYINVTYLQPIMEAFDDDGSGYITVYEVNRFVDALPPSIKWSLPHWIAYWAIGWQMASAEYCKKIQNIFAYMYSTRYNVLPENRVWVDYYLGKVWQTGTELVESFKRPQDIPPWLEAKFQEYVSFEEERIRKNLVDIHYDIDALDTVYIVAGPGRIEKYIYPLLYLLLKRDIEIFEVAKTKVLHKDELWDSADSIIWVYDAVWLRHKDLKTLFTQQKLDVDKQMKIFANEMFDYYNDWSTLFKTSNLESKEWPAPDADSSPVGQWDQSVKLLNYPIVEERPLSYEVYDFQPEGPSESDLQAIMPLKAIVGQWNGFIYDDKGYPQYPMMSFFAHVSSQEGFDFEASGLYYDSPMKVTGTCDQDCDGIVSMNLVMRCSRDTDTQYYSGHLLSDGSLVGTQGWEEKTPDHSNRFILRQVTAEVMNHRPPPHKFKENKAAALWKFAIRAIRAQVLRNMWSWTYFAERRDIRERLFRWNLRFFHYGRALTEHELKRRRETRQLMTIQDINFQRSILEYYQSRIIPSHLGFVCDGCRYEIGGTRLFCLDCHPKEGTYYKTVDFCDDPLCYGSTIDTKQRSDLERPHIPEHDLVKIRTVMQYRDQPDLERRAKIALNACREYFEKAGSKTAEARLEQREEHGPSHPEVAEVAKIAPIAGDSDDAGSERGSSNTSANNTLQAASDGDAELDKKVTNSVEPRSAKAEVADENHVEENGAAGPDAVSAHDDNASESESENESDHDSVSSTTTLQNATCGVCHNTVEQPCWFCVDCNSHDTKFFICDACERKTLLRCVACEQPFKQPTWYYGNQPSDNFLCNKCQVKGIEPPVIDKRTQHTYEHALVRCKVAYHENIVPTEDRIAALEAQVSALDGKVNAMDGKLSRLEDYLEKANAALGTLLARLSENMELRKS